MIVICLQCKKNEIIIFLNLFASITIMIDLIFIDKLIKLMLLKRENSILLYSYIYWVRLMSYDLKVTASWDEVITIHGQIDQIWRFIKIILFNIKESHFFVVIKGFFALKMAKILIKQTWASQYKQLSVLIHIRSIVCVFMQGLMLITIASTLLNKVDEQIDQSINQSSM